MNLSVLLQTPLFEAGVFLFGLLVGSFLNVVILRLPARMEHDWRCQCRELLELKTDPEDLAPPGLVWDRSRCPECGHGIRAVENVPLLSWILLRGRCSACKAPISLRYPAVEALTGIAFLLVALQFGPTTQGLAALVLTAFLIALSGIDLDHQLLPDSLTLSLLWLGLGLSLFEVFAGPFDAVLGAIAGYLSLWLVYQLFRLLTGKEGMGFGDFKLLAALGAWMGWQALPMVILLSSLVGALVGLTLMALRRLQRDNPLPFGPFIAAAGWIALLWGDQMMHAYLDLSGLG